MPRGIPNNPKTAKKRGRPPKNKVVVAAKRTTKATGDVVSTLVRGAKQRVGAIGVEVGEILKGIVLPANTKSGRESIYGWDDYEDGDTRPVKGVTLAALKNSVTSRNAKEKASGSKANFVAVEMMHEGKSTLMLGRRDELRRTRKSRKG